MHEIGPVSDVLTFMIVTKTLRLVQYMILMSPKDVYKMFTKTLKGQGGQVTTIIFFTFLKVMVRGCS